MTLDTKNSTVTVLLFVLTYLFGRCEAQGSNGSTSAVAIYIIIIAVGVVCLCFCFWIAFTVNYYRYYQRKNTPRVPQTTTTQHTFNLQRQPNYPQSQVIGPSSQRYPLQGYSSSSSTAIYPPPTTNVHTAVPQASESVYLPEATLHQGDAPPAYEEAIRMKTVSHVMTLP